MLKGCCSTLSIGMEVIYQSASFCSYLKAKNTVALNSEMAISENALMTNL